MTWKVEVKDSVSYADMTEETAALAYKIIWQMNQPATVELLVDDGGGAKTQTYGSAYMGTSAIKVEQPTNTEIFRGRIIAAKPDISGGTLRIHGEDWLGQLKDRLVTYDTREILDPNATNSVREMQLTPYKWAGTRCNAVVEAAGDSELWIGVGTGEHWNTDAYNGMKLCFPYSYLGTQTDYCYAYDESVTEAAGNGMTTDTPANGEANTWADDGSVHQLSNTEGAVDPYFYVSYAFKTLANDSALVDAITAIRVVTTYQFTGASGNQADIAIGPTGVGVYSLDFYPDAASLPMSDYKRATYTVPEQYLDNVVEANGIIHVHFSNRVVGGTGTVGVNVDYVHVEVDYSVNTALTSQYTIDDTARNPDVYDYLDLNGDTLVTDGICDYWKFYITDKVTVYVTDLVTTYDELYAIDASTSVTASTNYTGRHYHRMRPLGILQDLAEVDGTNFYLEAWDGDSIDLVWNSTYALNGEPTWTDSSVLEWVNPRQALQDVINEWFVEGYTSGDYKATGSDSDAGSITSYGRRSDLVSNPDVGSDIECAAEADARVDRTHDLPFHVGAVLDGYSTVNLGDVVNVNSTLLGLANQKYVVSRKEYDSRPATTTFYLTPRQDSLNIQRHLDNLMADMKQRLTHLETRMERGTRYTQSW